MTDYERGYLQGKADTLKRPVKTFSGGEPNYVTMPETSKEDIIRMARQAGVYLAHTELTLMTGLERFAALVAAHEREKVAKWMVERSYATGHGDTVEDLLKELEWQAAEREREECAKFCDEQYVFYGFDHVFAAGIRARGEK